MSTDGSRFGKIDLFKFVTSINENSVYAGNKNVFMQHRGNIMSNGFFFTPDELARFMADSRLDENGNIVYGSDAAVVVRTATRRAQRKSNRQPPTDLSNPEILSQKKAELTALLAESSRAIAEGKGEIIPEYKASKKIKLGKNTVANNPELHQIYETYRRIHSNAAPATLNNDPNDYLDSDE